MKFVELIQGLENGSISISHNGHETHDDIIERLKSRYNILSSFMGRKTMMTTVSNKLEKFGANYDYPDITCCHCGRSVFTAISSDGNITLITNEKFWARKDVDSPVYMDEVYQCEYAAIVASGKLTARIRT